LACYLKKLINTDKRKTLPLIKIDENNNINIVGCSCCQNTGLKTVCSKDNTTTIYYCSLQNKKKDLEKFIKFQEPLWQAKDHIDQLPSPIFEYIWTWLIHYKHKRINKGYLVSFEKKIPNFFQTLSLLSLWRLNIKPIHYCLGIQNINDFVKMTKLHIDEPLAPIVFLEQKKPFWKIAAREEFDYIANWCKNSGAPLWLSLYQNKEEKFSTSSSMVKFKKIIQQRKNKDQLHFLKETTINSLKDICQGYHPSLQKALNNFS
jgi:hypothetical protein